MKHFGDITRRGRDGRAATGWRATGFVIVALVAALSGPMPAQADTERATADVCTVAPAAAGPGATVTFSCADGTFSPFESVVVVVEGAPVAGTASLTFEAFSTRSTISTASGAISVPISFPSIASGSYDISAASATSAGDGTAFVSGRTGAASAVGRNGWLVGAWLGGGLLALAGAAIAVETSVRRSRRGHARMVP